jgi:hypothetical protein
MARNKGGVILVDNYQVKLEGALDPRVAVASKGDLIVRDTWPNDGGDPYLYDGLIVGVKDEKAVYMLVDKSKALYEDYSGWVRVDAGGVKIDNIFTYKSSVASYDVLPVVNEVGDVYNVEASFTLNDKEYPAGTNVAWNGTTWDPLAGSVDLSAYATKVEVAEVRASAATNASDIQGLSVALGAANAEIAKKVNAVEGSSLISADKLALIDATAGQVSALTTTAENLTGRVESLEQFFSDDSIEGGGLSLADVNAAIAALQQDKADKSALETLSGTVSTIQGTLDAAVALNGQQTELIEGLSGKVTNLESLYNGAVLSLSNTVNGHTQSISDLNTNLGLVKADVDVIKGDYLKAADIEGKLDTSVYEAKVAELVKADSDNLQSAKDYADEKASEAVAAAGAVNAALESEIARATAAEEANAAAIAVEKGRLDAILTGEGVSEALDSFKELQAWIETHEGGAADILAAASNAQKEVDALELVVAGIDEAYKAADAGVLAAAKAHVTEEFNKLGTAAYKAEDYFAPAGALALVKATADAAAPQATTYTKDEVNSTIGAAIAAAFEWVDVK